MYRFGAFELDDRSGDLRKHGVRIKLQEQPRKILLLLLEHPGEVVTRDQIQRNLWPDKTFVEFDNAINGAVRKLRDALGDTAENPRFLETLPRRGYRFIVPVTSRAEPAAERRDSRMERRIWPAVLAVLTGLGVAVAAWLAHYGSGEPAELRVMPLTANSGFELQPSFSPDGTRVAYVWNGPDGNNVAVYVKGIAAGNPVRITAGRDFSPAWSPDGQWIAVLRDLGAEDAVLLIPASGGPYRELSRIVKGRPRVEPCKLYPGQALCGTVFHGSWLSWSRDGRFLFASGSAKPDAALAIIRISTETGEQQRITSPPPDFYGDTGPAVSPDGRLLAFVRAVGGPEVADLYLLSLDGAGSESGPRRITSDGFAVDTPAWTRDGRELVYSSDRRGRRELWRVNASGSGKPVRLAGMGENAYDVAISSRGDRMVYGQANYSGSIWRVPLEDAGAGEPERVTATSKRDNFPRYSPDGKRIAFQSNRSGIHEIWICDAGGANLVQVTNFARGWSGSPSWSPDGRILAFDSNVRGSWDIYTVRADGGHPVRVTTGPADDFIPAWSRDGQWLYFASRRTGRHEIWKIRPDGSSETQVTSDGGNSVAESPDSRYLYYKTDGESPVWKKPAGGGPVSKVLDSAWGRMVGVTETRLYFLARVPTVQLRFLDLATGAVRVVAPLGGNACCAEVSPDERSVLYTLTEVWGTNLMLAENVR